MEMPQRDLRTLGQTVAGTFKRLIESQWVDGSDASVPSKRRIAAEEERFRLWARTLGLFQTGHASLDYRVRDATFVKTSLRDLVTELQDHLQNLLDIALGSRLPLEQDEEACRTGEETTSDDDGSLASSLSSSGSFQEAEFRLSSVNSRLDSLYKLASRIRSPRNRPQRPMADLCKHIPEAQRAEYIHNQEQIEASLLEYVQRQHLLKTFGDEELQELGLSQEELFAQYASASHWLIARMGRANARRKQQFLYWKKHAQNLGRNRDIKEEPAAPEFHTHTATTSHPGAQKNVEGQTPAKSMATSATKLDQNMMGPSDKKSVISTRSRTSTVVTPQGEKLAWPPAPTYPANIKYFPCPYCGILCPKDYLGQDYWRAHQIHDLQPYLCTYQDCLDPGRLYGNKQEWIDHENQHRRVWHCHKHEAEFQTLPEYLHHIGEKHPDTESEECMPEMTAAVVGASSQTHRDCPLCPTAFNDVVHMRKHMRYHLERLALYVLPDVDEDAEDQLASESPSDSHQVIENRGRQGSVANDFGEKLEAFLAEFEEEDEIAPHEIFGGDGPGLTRASLDQAQPPSNASWLSTYWAQQQNWLHELKNIGQTVNSYLDEEDKVQTRLIHAGAAAVEGSKATDSKTPTSSDGEADPDPPPDHLLYQVAWICTSETETSAVELILDEKYASFSHVGGDKKMMFCLGRVAQHRVVVVYFLLGAPYLKDTPPTHLLRVFPNVRIAVVVGIGGYAPSPQYDVRLGDIVTGGLGITEPEDESSLQGPPVFRDAAHALAERHPSYSDQRRGSQIHLEHIISRLTSRYRKKYSRPPAASDRLYRSDFAHPDPRQSCGVVCEDLSQLVPRESRGHDRPVIHYGAIDSSAGPIFDAVYRDGLATTRSAVCFKPDELDLRAIPCLVICGICDYADSHRNWEWRDHAAMLAAAYASDLLSFIPQHTLDDMEPIRIPRQAPDVGGMPTSTSQGEPQSEPTARWITFADWPGDEYDWVCRPDGFDNIGFLIVDCCQCRERWYQSTQSLDCSNCYHRVGSCWADCTK